MVGLPFFVVSSNAPLLQRWFSYLAAQKRKENTASHPSESENNDDPYFLYAFSNVGSLGALIAYPFLIEPWMGLTLQTGFWLFGFLTLATGFVLCGFLVFCLPRFEFLDKDQEQERANLLSNKDSCANTWKQRIHWIILAAIPSSLMLGVTTYLATDVGSIPMLWVVPLAIYLLTFILSFARIQILPHTLLVRISPVLILLMAVLLLVDLGTNPWAIAPFHLLTFFVVSMVCHGELNRTRPPADKLTEFYLLMSIGGFLGGTFNALIAPVVFNEIAEYPLALVAACFMRPQLNAAASKQRNSTKQNSNSNPKASRPDRTWQSERFADFLWPVGIAIFGFLAMKVTGLFNLDVKISAALVLFVIPAFLCYSFVEKPIRFGLTYAVIVFSCQWMLTDRNVVEMERGFFGVNKVALDLENGYRTLINGRTMHGIQRINDHQTEPLSYYHQQGPVGDIFGIANRRDLNRVGVIGLGTGSIASYSEPHQTFDFYEIDPVVCKFASDEKYFCFLKEAKGKTNLILGDARIKLSQHISADPQSSLLSYDLLILDAFSSDSIPTHLLTREATSIYSHVLSGRNGILAIHITNKHMDLKPLVVSIAKNHGWTPFIREDHLPGDHTDNDGRLSSVWVVLVQDEFAISAFSNQQGWRILDEPGLPTTWTDEYSNVLEILSW